MKIMNAWKLLVLIVFIGCKPNYEEDFSHINTNTVEVKDGKVVVKPREYGRAIRNPMKGLREFFGPGYDVKRSEYPYPFGSMVKEYMQWNMIENQESDGVDKIMDYSDHRWAGVEDMNVKVIPRIFIIWMEPWHGGYAKNTYVSTPDDLNGWHWPSDIPGQTYSPNITIPITGGYFDPNFQYRLKKLVEKAGQAWDNDPRVAYVEMGIIGEWGEHHDPSITTYWKPHDQEQHVANRTWIPGVEKTLGDAFTAAFKNKKVMVRYAYEFKDYDFGIYWDSFAEGQEQERGYEAIKQLGDRWKTQPIGGEITWNWGDMAKFKSFEEVIVDASMRKNVLDQIRSLHCNHLGGVTWANFKNLEFLQHAESIQKALGYRYVIDEFVYPTRVDPGKNLKVSFKVRNTGSSPFYYDWPVEIALVHKSTQLKEWSAVLSNVNISSWMPGENWDSGNNQYTQQAKSYTIEGDLAIPSDIAPGEYMLAISINDPAGNLPSIRFATINYIQGGRHPMGYIGVGQQIDNFEISRNLFVDLAADKTLYYEYKRD